MRKFDVYCRYCGFNQVWTFAPDGDFRDMEDIIDFDYEYSCNMCGCNVRVNEALDNRDMLELGYE